MNGFTKSLEDSDLWKALKIWWHPTKNLCLPSQVGFQAHDDLWWRCPHGHEFQASAPFMAKSPTPCQACKSLTLTHPHLEDEFLTDESGRSFSSLTPGLGAMWWRCSEGHRYEMTVANKVKGQRCPFCVGRRVLPGVNDLASRHPELLPLYAEENEKPATETIFTCRAYRLWRHPSCGHTERRIVPSLIDRPHCLFCSGEKHLPGFNDVDITHPHLLHEWDEEANGKPLKGLGLWHKDQTIFHWRCSQCGHKTTTKLSRRAEDSWACAACEGFIVHAGLNDITVIAPHLVPEIALDLCDVPLGKIGLTRSVWWRCSEGHHFKGPLKYKMKGLLPCRTCHPRSQVEDEVMSFVESFLPHEEVTRNTRSIIPPRELDIYLPSLKKAIEVNGDYWHSTGYLQGSRGVSAEVYHQEKMKACARQGIALAFVWEDDWRMRRREVEAWMRAFLEGDKVPTGLSRLRSALDV